MSIFTTRPEIIGTFGVAASTHWLAAQTPMGVLERGGNAFDAAVAGGFVLQVVEPHLNGPGGEVPILLWNESDRQAQAICGQGVGPAGARPPALPRLGPAHKPPPPFFPPPRPWPLRRRADDAARPWDMVSGRRSGAGAALCPGGIRADTTGDSGHPRRRGSVSSPLAHISACLAARQPMPGARAAFSFGDPGGHLRKNHRPGAGPRRWQAHRGNRGRARRLVPGIRGPRHRRFLPHRENTGFLRAGAFGISALRRYGALASRRRKAAATGFWAPYADEMRFLEPRAGFFAAGRNAPPCRFGALRARYRRVCAWHCRGGQTRAGRSPGLVWVRPRCFA